MEPTTAEAMIKFIYSGQIEDLDQEDRSKSKIYYSKNRLSFPLFYFYYYSFQSERSNIH